MHTDVFTLADLPGALRRLYLLWQASDRGTGVRLRDIDLAELTTDLDSIILTEIHRGPDPGAVDFEIAFLGKEVRERLGSQFLGKRQSHMPDRGPGTELWAAYEALARDNRPILARLPYAGPCADIVRTLKILLPLCPDEGEAADPPRYALCGVHYCGTDSPVQALSHSHHPGTAGAA